MTSLARVLAADSMSAQRITVYRHLPLSDRPIVLIPLTLAGETNTPLAAMIGTRRDAPRVIVTRQPRIRSERLVFAERLADELLPVIDQLASEVEPVDASPDARMRAVSAPQVWVPNPAGVDYVRLLGRMTRFRAVEGPKAVAPQVKRLGVWLTWLAEQAEFADTSALVCATTALTSVWATGQSSVEDGNLSALMAWLSPPAGLTVAQAVRQAEDPALCPPAGPSTDPTFDRIFLEPVLQDLSAAPEGPVRDQVLARMTSMLTDQLAPTWELMWRAIEMLREVPSASHVERRWERQRDRFTAFQDYLLAGGHPQAKRDTAVRGAQRLVELEQRQAAYEAQRAYDDPLIMADYRLTGEAFAGEVTYVDPTRLVTGTGRAKLRPLVCVSTADPVRMDVGDEVHDPSRNGQKARVGRLTFQDPHWEVVLELQDKMGRSTQAPEPGSVPELGDQVVYTKLKEDFARRGRAWPTREATPWTHGGPPPEYVPLPDDATEEWS